MFFCFPMDSIVERVGEECSVCHPHSEWHARQCSCSTNAYTRRKGALTFTCCNTIHGFGADFALFTDIVGGGCADNFRDESGFQCLRLQFNRLVYSFSLINRSFNCITYMYLQLNLQYEMLGKSKPVHAPKFIHPRFLPTF